MAIWSLHGNGKSVAQGEVVNPDERLTWPRTVSMGLQHVVAMFGATFLVPLLTGFPPTTTLFFSAVGTVVFLLLTGNRLPSYLGSSFAFIAPILAAKAADHGGMGTALFGVMAAGILLAIIGLIVHLVGPRWIDIAMPPVVTGTVVMLIGFNLAPSAYANFHVAPVTAGVTVAAILLVNVLFRGMIGKLSILIGVLVGYVTALFQHQVSFKAMDKAAWVGFPHFQHPTVNWSVLGLFLPVIFALIGENIGHVKSVALMTGRNFDKSIGRALMADGLATMLAGAGGGSGTTTYAENIGVMAATRIYSTAVYWVAAAAAFLLSLCPKFGALIATIPTGVLGGAGVVLYGMIGILGARIWIENKVDFSSSINLMTAAVALIAGIANFTFVLSKNGAALQGIAVGSFAAIIIYHLMRLVAHVRGTFGPEAAPASPASASGKTPLE